MCHYYRLYLPVSRCSLGLLSVAMMLILHTLALVLALFAGLPLQLTILLFLCFSLFVLRSGLDFLFFSTRFVFCWLRTVCHLRLRLFGIYLTTSTFVTLLLVREFDNSYCCALHLRCCSLHRLARDFSCVCALRSSKIWFLFSSGGFAEKRGIGCKLMFVRFISSFPFET